MYFHSVHGKNIKLSADSSQARRIDGFCQAITFSNNPLVPLQRITFLVGSEFDPPVNRSKKINSKKSAWNGNLRIGLTTKNPVSLISSELPEFSYPTLLNTEGFWITCVKSSYLRNGNRISLVLDKNNCLQLEINYVVKAVLFANSSVPVSLNTKLWLILDLYGSTNVVQFLPSDDTPYEIKQRGLDAVNNFHSACLTGGSRSIYKTRLLILGQEGSCKTSLKNCLVDWKDQKKESDNQKKLDLSASFKVSIDHMTSSWELKSINKFDLIDKEKQTNLARKFNSSIRFSNSENSLLHSSRSFRSQNLTILQASKKRSSSTSYLNEEDDYGDDFGVYEDAKKYRRQYSFDDDRHKSKGALWKNNSLETAEEDNSDLNESNNTLIDSKKEIADIISASSSGESSKENSDFESESDEDLYAIDEYDELIQTLDCDPNELKKDLSGYYYKRIAMNIYQELINSKLMEKLSAISITEDQQDIYGNNVKLALAEFESSIYNQLGCSKILFLFYEQIVYNELKLLKTKPISSTILVHSMEDSPSEMPTEQKTNNLLSQVNNLKQARKKLSLTISDLADQTYQVLFSSRAVYIVCFDLTKDLNDLAQTNLDFENEKNIELSNLDYLDFLFKSIHSYTAKIPESPNQTNLDNKYITFKINENQTINFKYSTLLPPIIIVGTNKNRVHYPDTIRQKFERIKEFVSNKIYANHLVEPYVAIDNLMEKNSIQINSINNADKSNINLLKKIIEFVALNEPYMGEQQPLKWMRFEKSLEKLKNKGLFYASLSQICEIAHEKDINTQEELTTCLNFLNDLGVIVYYGNANDIFLRNTIILRPQKLIEIFNLILIAKMPSSIGQLVEKNTQSNSGLQWIDLWNNFDQRGILDDRLLDILWKKVLNQKPGLLGLMKKFDLIAERNQSSSSEKSLLREYLVPSRAKIKYDQDTDKQFVNFDSDNDDIEDLSDFSLNRFKLENANISIVEFYYDFSGFLPESLFHRIVTRAARWTLMKNGADPKTSVRMYFRKARFYLDSKHDFLIEMAPIKFARIKIQVIRLSTSVNGYAHENAAPEPNACAKVRNFMETALIDLRNLWVKRLTFNACVQCYCDKLCKMHYAKLCTNFKCLHLLNLDECLTNNIVTCEYRRVKTLIYKSWFPTQNISLHKGPVLNAVKSYSDKNMFYDENSLPSWVKNVAKLLQTSNNKENKEGHVITIHNENDWLALARLLGYNKSRINYFNESDNPALQLICDWIMSSDNTNLTIEFLINYLEQIKRDDVIKIINNEREKETVNSSVFISYQWDSQDIVIKIKDHLEKAGFNCFMDIGQIGGGNLLYQKIDQAIRNAKVVIACISPKFVVSHYCNREMALADLLRKPIVPIMLTATPWPPPGGMGLIFSQLVYVDYFGVGGHGGCGINADLEQRNNEIVAMVARHVNPSSYFLMNIDRIKDNEKVVQKSKRTFLENLKPSQLMRSSPYYNRNDENPLDARFLSHRTSTRLVQNNQNINNSNHLATGSRSRMATQAQGSLMHDIAAVCCCTCCAMIQIKREFREGFEFSKD